MGFKPVQVGNAIDIKKEGVSAVHIGTYVGNKQITTKIGNQTIWQFTDADGVPFGIYGFTNLNRQMESVVVGKLCRITYKGTKNLKTKFGMKDVHQVLVEVDDDAGYNSGEAV